MAEKCNYRGVFSYFKEIWMESNCPLLTKACFVLPSSTCKPSKYLLSVW